MIPTLDRVLDPSYLGGLDAAPMADVRSMRAECTELENGLSYLRRIAQGRLDLLSEELRRRADGAGGNLGDLVDGLADMLSDGVRGPASGRLDQHLEPPEALVAELTDVLDAVVGPPVVSSVADLDDDELTGAVGDLRGFEEQVSSARRSLHDAIDGLNNELARRIASGEATAGSA